MQYCEEERYFMSIDINRTCKFRNKAVMDTGMRKLSSPELSSLASIYTHKVRIYSVFDGPPLTVSLSR